MADPGGNGAIEVIASAYSVIALTGTTGELIWRISSEHDRTEYPDNVGDVGRT